MTEDAGDDGGFLNRWSARKRRQSQQENDARDTRVSDPLEMVESEGGAEPGKQLFNAENILESSAVENDFPTTVVTDDKQQTEAGVELDAIGESEEAPLLTDEDMLPVESLTADSDMSAFFNRGVSAALRRAALRHVFHQPVFNVRDGLNDYDGDYTVFEPLGDTITSDMKWHTARKERERLEAQAREEEQREQERLEEEQHTVLEEGGAEASTQDTDTHVTDAQDTDAYVTDDQDTDVQVTDDQDTDAQVTDSPKSDTQNLVNQEPDTHELVDLGSYATESGNQELEQSGSGPDDWIRIRTSRIRISRIRMNRIRTSKASLKQELHRQIAPGQRTLMPRSVINFSVQK